jgi:hypothetical protein
MMDRIQRAAGRAIVLVACLVGVGCDDETWDPAELGTSAPRAEEPPPVINGAAPSGTARMPSLPAAPTAEQEAQIAQLIAEANAGGGGGGRGGEMPAALRPYDRFGENGEGLSNEQAATLLANVLGAGRNVLGQDVTPCDRVMAMAGAAAGATGDQPIDEEEVRRVCGRIPPEVLACLQPGPEQSAVEQRRCRNLFGQSSLLERVNEEDRTPIPRARTEADIRRLLVRPQEEAPPPEGPREQPLVVQ